MDKSKAFNKELRKYVKDVEKNNGDFISYVLDANSLDKEHIMLVEGKKFFEEAYNLSKNELSPLEKVDLIDYWEMVENGRTNKKRRNILRRP